MPVDYYTRMAQDQNRRASQQARRAAALQAQQVQQAQRAATNASQLEHQQQMAMQQEAEKQRERQMILQSNLSSNAAAARMYAQNQYDRKAGRLGMAGDAQLRQRNKMDAIKAGKAQQHAARMDHYRQQELARDQAGLQAERDAQLHGYGTEDAAQLHGYGMEDMSQANEFNVGMANLTHGNQLQTNRLQHGYGQQDARQLWLQKVADARTQQGYGRENAKMAQRDAIEKARIQDQFNQDAARQKQAYSLETLGRSHDLNMDRDQFGYDLDQRGAVAQQRRTEDAAIAQQGRTRDDVEFGNDMLQDSELDKTIKQQLNDGWTYTPSQQASIDSIDAEQKRLLEVDWNNGINQAEIERQLKSFKRRKRSVGPPTQKPTQKTAADRFNENTYQSQGQLYYVPETGQIAPIQPPKSNVTPPPQADIPKLMSSVNAIMKDDAANRAQMLSMESNVTPPDPLNRDDVIWDQIKYDPVLMNHFRNDPAFSGRIEEYLQQGVGGIVNSGPRPPYAGGNDWQSLPGVSGYGGPGPVPAGPGPAGPGPAGPAGPVVPGPGPVPAGPEGWSNLGPMTPLGIRSPMEDVDIEQLVKNAPESSHSINAMGKLRQKANEASDPETAQAINVLMNVLKRHNGPAPKGSPDEKAAIDAVLHLQRKGIKLSELQPPKNEPQSGDWQPSPADATGYSWGGL